MHNGNHKNIEKNPVNLYLVRGMCIKQSHCKLGFFNGQGKALSENTNTENKK